MKAVIQRVKKCSVEIDGAVVSSIGEGFLVLLGVHKNDEYADADKLAAKVANLRVFSDQNDKMNLSLLETGFDVMVVSQFTLCADCRKGRRPNFMEAAAPPFALPLYERFCESIKKEGVKKVERGVFGEDMQVSLINDGPVTILIDTADLA